MHYSSEHAIAVAEELRHFVLGANDSETEKIEEAANVIVGLVRDRDDVDDRLANVQGTAVAMNETLNRLRTVRPLADWSEDVGPALWVTWPINQPPWVGTPGAIDKPAGFNHFLPLPDLRTVFLAPGEV